MTKGYRHLDARTIVVERTPQMPTFDDKPEPTKIAPRKLTREELCKKFKWSDDDVELAFGLGFPAADRRITRGGWGFTLVWNEDLVDRWAREQQEQAQLRLRLVGQ